MNIVFFLKFFYKGFFENVLFEKKKLYPKKSCPHRLLLYQIIFLFFYFEENLSYMRFDSQSFTKFTYGEKSFKINDNKIKSMQL